MKILKQLVVLLFFISIIVNNVLSTSQSSSSSSSYSSSSSSSSSNGLGPYQDYDLNWLSKHLTTKTPYYKLTKDSDDNSANSSAGSSSNNNEDSASSSSSTSNQLPSQCKLVSIDFVARHGSRLPVESSIIKLNQMAEAIYQYQDKISKQFHWIFNWTVPYPQDIAGNLILQGQYEHYNISKRLLNKYPEYFSNMKYKPQNYEISSTLISRTGISASSFIYGILEGTGKLPGNNYQPVFHQTASLNEDHLLRFFDTCDYYTDQIKNGTINKSEQQKWQELVFPNISTQISERLGLSKIWMPTNNVVSDIFELCAYEISINNISDHWCSLLSRQNILDWEYSEDLSNYWIKSYGHKVNYKIASLLLQKVIDGFDKYVKAQDKSTLIEPVNILRFGHAETIIPFITLLGLYNDTSKLYSNSTKDQIENRLFRTSVVSPYASNIGLFLFDCTPDSSNSSDSNSDSSSSSNGYSNFKSHRNYGNFKILVEHNELPVLIPGCDDKYCNYSIFRKLFSDALSFNWDTYCKVNSSSPIPPSPTPSHNNDSGSVSHHINPLTLAIFLPVTFLVGLAIGGLVIWIGHDKIKKFNNNRDHHVTLYGPDELIPSPTLKGSSSSSNSRSKVVNVNSPLIEK